MDASILTLSITGLLGASPLVSILGIEWEVSSEDQSVRYSVSTNLIDGRSHDTEASATRAALERLMPADKTAPVRVSSGPQGEGVAPIGLPAELAALLALADLGASESAHVASSGAAQQDGNDRLVQQGIKSISQFSPSRGVTCVTVSRLRALVLRDGSAPGARVEDLKGLESTERARERLNLQHEVGSLLWSMEPDSEGHVLRLIIESQAGGVANSTWSLLCRSPSPILANELVGLEWSTVLRNGAWEVRVRRAAVTTTDTAPTSSGLSRLRP